MLVTRPAPRAVLRDGTDVVPRAETGLHVGLMTRALTARRLQSMTSTAVPSLSDAPARHRALWRGVLTAALVVSALVLAVSVLGLLLDPRTIAGAPAWAKPAKFGLSSALYVLGLRYVLDRLDGAPRRTALIAVGVAVALGLELAWIVLQVVRGTGSHFNEATALDAALFRAAGGVIGTVLGLTVVAEWLVLRQAGLDAVTAAGLRWGVGVCLVGMASAGLMIANTGVDPAGAHTVGAADGGPGLPLLGWSTQHGDLRIAHFAGLHALQALPLLAWALGRTALAGRTQARLVAVAGSSQLALVALLAWQAERGQALLQPDPLTLGALGTLATTAAVGAALVLRADQPPATPVGRLVTTAGPAVR